jgi:hypothetical protein
MQRESAAVERASFSMRKVMDIVLLYAMYRMHNPKRSAKKRRAAITVPKIAL